MNDQTLLAVMKKYHLTGEFFLHPALAAQLHDFRDNEVFRVAQPPYNYNRAFAEGNLLVTDYSSVAFDFAYLGKPVLYTQFDHDEINSGQHIFTKNYITSEKDGFGPVVYNYDSTIREIVKLIENNFKMLAKHQRRSDEFYFYRDQKNCHRLFYTITGRD